QIESSDCGVILDSRRVLQDFLDLPGDRVRALDRSRKRKLRADENVTLIFLGQKTGRQFFAKPTGGNGYNRQKYQAQCRLSDESAGHPHITVSRAPIQAIEPVEEFTEWSTHCFLGSEQQRRESRAKGEGVKRRDED